MAGEVKISAMKYFAAAALFALVSCGANPEPASSSRTAEPHTGHSGARIAAYCVKQAGKTVGNGECWTLADEAFKASGVKRPGINARVWGREVNPAKESLRRGDVLEFQSAKFYDGHTTVTTGPAHTAVVVTGGSRHDFTIAEQNWGKRTVRIRTMDLTKLTGGKVRVYRPA